MTATTADGANRNNRQAGVLTPPVLQHIPLHLFVMNISIALRAAILFCSCFYLRVFFCPQLEFSTFHFSLCFFLP